MLLNLSNHPSSHWPAGQIAAAAHYGELRDEPFPAIPPAAAHYEVRAIAERYYHLIRRLAAEEVVTVHLMGEMTFAFMLVDMLRQAGIPCVASTSERIVLEEADGRKVSQFQFVQFRSYY